MKIIGAHHGQRPDRCPVGVYRTFALRAAETCGWSRSTVVGLARSVERYCLETSSCGSARLEQVARLWMAYGLKRALSITISVRTLPLTLELRRYYSYKILLLYHYEILIIISQGWNWTAWPLGICRFDIERGTQTPTPYSLGVSS